jgi:stage V sporulation protein AD
MRKNLGRQTMKLDSPPSIVGYGNVVGKKENEGPLSAWFDGFSKDDRFEQDSWEKAECTMQETALQKAMSRAQIKSDQLDFLMAGDLLNQCISSSFAARSQNVPFLGLYGACSTMGESMALASLLLNGGFGSYAGAVTSSHFCTAERQYRTPLAYGGQRTPTAQWTATASGAVILQADGTAPPYVTHVTIGKIVDKGITDANNMGAAMAPAAFDTIFTHFQETGRKPTDYDLIVTGDLGALGKELLIEFFKDEGMNIASNYEDCGVLLYDAKNQDVHCGGSGCGCSAAVLTGYLLGRLRNHELNRILFCPTGALLSPTTTQQGESIPSVAHAVVISNQKD